MTSLLAVLCLSRTGQESPWGSFFQNAALGSFWAQQWNKKPLQEYVPKISLARCSRKLLAARTTAHKPCRAGPKKSLGRCGRARFGLGVGSFLLARCFRKLSAPAPPAWVYSACLIAEIFPLQVQVALAQLVGHALRKARAEVMGSNPIGACGMLPQEVLAPTPRKR